MVSTVLVETGGVITEDRYQKMTPIQWQFQYLMIQNYRANHRKHELQNELLLQDILSQDIETLSMVINPDISDKFMRLKREHREKSRAKIFDNNKVSETNTKTDETNINNIDIHDDQAVQNYMEKYYDTVPDTITIPAQVINQNRYVLPKFNKEQVLKKSKRKFIQLEPNNGQQNVSIEKVSTQTSELTNIKIVPKSKNNRKKINLPKEGEENGNE